MPDPITDWDAVDWHRPNPEIARDLGCKPDTVSGRRRRHAPETVGKYNASTGTGMTAAQWRAVDWRYPNRVLIRMLEKSEPRIAEMRKRYGHPATIKSPTNHPPKSPEEMKRAGQLAETYQPSGAKAAEKLWEVRPPGGAAWTGKNLRKYVREHYTSFDPADVEQVIGSSGRSYTRAEKALYHIAATGGKWKGWKCRKITDPDKQTRQG